MYPVMKKTKSNWFLTWEEQDTAEEKALLLQLKLNNLVFWDLLGDIINSFVIVFRRQQGHHTWQELGRTAIIHDESNPEYPEGFRVSFDKKANLSEDMLKVVCYNHRDTLGHDDIIGTAKISLRELVRAFGTRVQVELIKKKTEKIVGSVWFLGEALPAESFETPKVNTNRFKFNISSMAPRKAEIKHQTPRVFLLVSREREDKTWSVVYRSAVVKRGSFVGLVNRKAPLTFRGIEIAQSEIVLGLTPARKVKLSFFQKGRHGEPHICTGEVTTSVDELLNDFMADTSIDLCLNGKIIGEFADISRSVDDENVTTFEIEVNYFDSESDAREVQERRKNKTLNLDSP